MKEEIDWTNRQMKNAVFRWRKLKKFHKRYKCRWGIAAALCMRVIVYGILVSLACLIIALILGEFCGFTSDLAIIGFFRDIQIAIDDAAFYCLEHILIWVCAPIFLVWALVSIGFLFVGVDINE